MADNVGFRNRPEELQQLFPEGSAYPDWEAFNWRHRRFFITGAHRLLGRLRIPHTHFEPFVRNAERIIHMDTRWNEQFPGEYIVSKTQLYPGKIDEAKTLDKAAVIVVALEEMAREVGLESGVYDEIGIMPAFYFVDDLTKDRLKALSSAYDQLPRGVRDSISDKIGLPVNSELQEVLTRFLYQPFHSALLRELSSGYSVTKNVAHGVVQFVERVFEGRMPLGPVRPCGAQAYAPELGQKDAAPSMRIVTGEFSELERLKI